MHTGVGNYLAKTVLRSDPIACWLLYVPSSTSSSRAFLCSVLCYVLFVLFVSVCIQFAGCFEAFGNLLLYVFVCGAKLRSLYKKKLFLKNKDTV